jgi:predicted lipase
MNKKDIYEANPVKIAAIEAFPKVVVKYPNFKKSDYNLVPDSEYNYKNGILLSNMINSILVSTQNCPKNDKCSPKTGKNEYKTPKNTKLLKKLYIKDDIGNERLLGVILKQEQTQSVIIAFRGTQTEYEWNKIDKHALPPMNSGYGFNVAPGFYNVFNQIKNDIFQTLLKEEYNYLYVTGHSLGAAVATILSAFLVKLNKIIYIYTFGSPRCLSNNICNLINSKQNMFFYRIVNIEDSVPPSVPAATYVPIYTHPGKQITYHYNGRTSAENHAFYLKEYNTGNYENM